MAWEKLAYTDDGIASLSDAVPQDVIPTEAPGAGTDASRDDHSHEIGGASVETCLEMSSAKVQVVDDSIVLAKKAASGWIVANEGLQEDGATHALEVDLSAATLELDGSNQVSVVDASIDAAKIDETIDDLEFDELVLTVGTAPTEVQGAVYYDATANAIKVCTASA